MKDSSTVPKIKMIILDGDGTSWHYPVGEFGSSWDALSQVYGLLPQARKMLEHYYPKKELYSEWALKQAALFKDKEVFQAEKQMYPVPYTPGFREFVSNAKRRVKVGLLTVGLHIPALRVQRQCGLDFCICNELPTHNGKFTGGYIDRVPLWRKLDMLQEFLYDQRIKPEEVCYVGDTKGDVPCMNSVGLAFAFNPKDDETRNSVPAERIIHDHRESIKHLNLSIEP